MSRNSRTRIPLQEVCIAFKRSKEALIKEQSLKYKDYQLCNRLEKSIRNMFNDIYRTLKIPIYKRIESFLKGYRYEGEILYELAWEANSETFDIFYNKIEKYDEVSMASTWIYAIATNEARRIASRETNKFKETLFSQIAQYGSTDEFNDGDDFVSRLLADSEPTDSKLIDLYPTHDISNSKYEETPSQLQYRIDQKKYDIAVQCIKELPEKSRTIISDKYLKSIKQSDLPKIHGINLNTIKTRDRKAKADLNVIWNMRMKKLYSQISEGSF